jgi:hypothetical protein
MSNHVPLGYLNSFAAISGKIIGMHRTEFPKKGISADRISYTSQLSSFSKHFLYFCISLKNKIHVS